MPHKHKPLLSQKHITPIYSKRSNHRMNTDHNNRIPHNFNKNLCKTMFCINLFHFTKYGQICDISHAVAKSAAERDNSNSLSAHSTPSACFFMLNIRTSILIGLKCPFSMVACSGQRLIVGCLPIVAVCHPVTRYRPSVTTSAVTSQNLLSEFNAMKQFIFAAIRRTDLTNHIVKIRINANTEQEARKPLAREFVLVLAGRINLKNTSDFNRTLAAQSPALALSTQGGEQ